MQLDRIANNLLACRERIAETSTVDSRAILERVDELADLLGDLVQHLSRPAQSREPAGPITP